MTFLNLSVSPCDKKILDCAVTFVTSEENRIDNALYRELWYQPHQLSFFLLLLSANEVCEGYIFTGVCLFTEGGFGLCPGGFHPAGVSVKGGSLSGGSLSRVRGSLSGRVSVQGGLCQADPLDKELLYGNERALRILLECILVNKKIHLIQLIR